MTAHSGSVGNAIRDLEDIRDLILGRPTNQIWPYTGYGRHISGQLFPLPDVNKLNTSIGLNKPPCHISSNNPNQHESSKSTDGVNGDESKRGRKALQKAQRELVEMKRELEGAKRRTADKEKELAKADLSRKEVQRGLFDAKKKILDREKELADKERELKRLREKNGELANVRKEMADKERQLANKERELADKDRELKLLREEGGDEGNMRKKLVDKEKELADKERELKRLREKNREDDATMREELAKKERELKRLKDESEENERGIKKELDDIRRQLENTKQRLKEAEEVVNSDETSKELAEVKKQLADAKKKLEDSEQEVANAKEANEEVLNMKKRVAEKEKELSKAKEENKELLDTKQQLRDAKNEIAKQKELNKGLSDAKKKLVDTEKQLQEAEKEVSKLEAVKKELSDTKNQLSDLKTQLLEKEKIISDTKTELSDTKNQLSDKDKQLLDLETQLSNEKEKVKDTRERLSETNTQLSDMKNNLSDKEKELAEALKNQRTPRPTKTPIIQRFITADGTADPDRIGEVSKQITFPKAYPTPPSIAVALNSLDMSNEDSMYISCFPNNLATESFNINIDGTVVNSGGCNWLEIEPDHQDFQCGRYSTLEDHPWNTYEQYYSRRITFTRPYNEPPEIVVWLSSFNFTTKKGWRILVDATEITETGFVISIEKAGDSELLAGGANWIAYPKGRKGVCSGTFGAEEGPKSDLSGNIVFPENTFMSIPNIMMGFTVLDVEWKDSLCLETMNTEVSERGMKWHLKAGKGTTFAAGFGSYIALV